MSGSISVTEQEIELSNRVEQLRQKLILGEYNLSCRPMGLGIISTSTPKEVMEFRDCGLLSGKAVEEQRDE